VGFARACGRHCIGRNADRGAQGEGWSDVTAPQTYKSGLDLTAVIGDVIGNHFNSLGLVLNPHAISEPLVKGRRLLFAVTAPCPGVGLNRTTVSIGSAPRAYALLRRSLLRSGEGSTEVTAALIDELQACGVLVPANRTPKHPVFDFASAETELSAFVTEDGIPKASRNASAESIRIRKCAIVPGFLPEPLRLRLWRYYETLMKQGFMRMDESQSRRLTLHNETVAKWLHHATTPIVRDLIPEPIKPSYSYLGFYLSGAVLGRHVDREQCEYTISFALSAEPSTAVEDAWPLYAELESGEEFKALLAPGDALVFKGRELPHYRHPLADGRSSQSIFLHYVHESFSGRLT
jgi:hypothetical protein